MEEKLGRIDLTKKILIEYHQFLIQMGDKYCKERKDIQEAREMFISREKIGR